MEVGQSTVHSKSIIESFLNERIDYASSHFYTFTIEHPSIRRTSSSRREWRALFRASHATGSQLCRRKVNLH